MIVRAGSRAYPSDMTDAERVEVRAPLPVPAWLEGRGGQPEGCSHRPGRRPGWGCPGAVRIGEVAHRAGGPAP
ncbi:hypothetical protein B1K54_35385 [Streptomyces sp. fd1-xmd]|nr:hypothetical protein B1K54_35385 [Streptomyces sp. fd1-xmd]